MQDDTGVETYAPVAKLTSFRALIAVAAVYDLELYDIDVKTTFLQAPLPNDQKVYMHLPPIPTHPPPPPSSTSTDNFNNLSSNVDDNDTSNISKRRVVSRSV